MKKIAVIFLCVLILLLTASLVVLGCARIFHVNRSDTYLFTLAVMVQVFKFLNLTTECMMWFFVVIVVFNYMSAWDPCQIKKRSYTESPVANTLMYFQDYHKKGHETEAYRKALQGWFLLQYLVYLLYIYTDIIHIVRPYFSGNGHHGVITIIHHALFIGYDLAGFVLSYMLALWMIEAHRNYYVEINKHHLAMDDILSKKIKEKAKEKRALEREKEITLEQEEVHEQIAQQTLGRGRHLSTQEMAPGGEQSAMKEITPVGEEAIPVAPLEEAPLERSKRVALEQVELQGEEGGTEDLVMSEELKAYIAMKIEVCTDFDFCPQFLDISVPLSSPGYSVSVLIALFALIASFVP